MRANFSSVELWEISYIATSVLADAQSAQQAADRILQLIGSRMEADFAALWMLDGIAPVIRCAAIWPDNASGPYATVTRARTFELGEGMPGKAWETRDVVWRRNLATSEMPRASVARLGGIKAVIAFPLYRGDVVSAAIEVCSAEEWEPDEALIEFLRALGSQIGLLLDHLHIAVNLSGADSQSHLIANLSKDAVITIDESSTVLSASPAIHDLLGYQPDELIGQSLTILMPENLKELHRAGIRRYSETGERHLDWDKVLIPGQHKDGSRVPLRVAFAQFLRGGKRVFTGFMRKADEE